MIKSMTGFGRSENTVDGMHVTVEIRTVNHRYYEYSSRLPRLYGYLDEKLKAHLQTRLSRGKVDIALWIDTQQLSSGEVYVNSVLAKRYVEALRDLSAQFDLPMGLTAETLSRFPDVLTVEQEPVDEEAVWQVVRGVTDGALDRLVAMREREGARLREDVLSRAAAILHGVEIVEKRSPLTVKEHMAKVEARMRELLDGAAVDEQRLLTEAAVFADKIAVAEETVRLRSHLEQLAKMMDSGEPVGRKLDFLIQEINRETNTIGSKASDLDITRCVVDIKAEIEKIREQIQNIE